MSKDQPITLNSMADEMDPAALAPLLAQGEVALIRSHESGALAQVTVAGAATASREKVWDTIRDYPNYPKFMPGMKKTRVLEQGDNTSVVAYELSMPGKNMKYTLAHEYFPMDRVDISVADPKGDIKSGAWRWDLYDHPESGKTIILYSVYTDLRESSWILKQVLKSQPQMEHGMNVAAGLVTLQALVRKASGV